MVCEPLSQIQLMKRITMRLRLAGLAWGLAGWVALWPLIGQTDAPGAEPTADRL